MDLKEAIEVLKIEAGCAGLDKSNGYSNENTDRFISACEIAVSVMEGENVYRRALEKIEEIVWDYDEFKNTDSVVGEIRVEVDKVLEKHKEV